MGELLKVLHEAEANLVDAWLGDPDSWQSLDIKYETPHVERLWRQFGDYRVYLHRIHTCQTALFHPHPWPSAVTIVAGTYEMEVGYSGDHENKDSPPPVAARFELTQGCSYEMVNPDAWHSVRPLGVTPMLSVMVSGLPWERRRWSPKPTYQLGSLSEAKKHEILALFGQVY